MSSGEGYTSAVERAKQIVTKFSSGEDTQPNGAGTGIKRTSDDNSGYASAEKRRFVNDKTAAVVAEAAARISQKLSASSQPTSSQSVSTLTCETTIPDRFVGLVIGKKGEQITSLQNDSNCKVQISQEGGRPERAVTLIGTPQQIQHAKQLLSDIIDKAEKSGGGSTITSVTETQNAYPSGGPITTIELLIPGSKAGLVIGKNGETIKQLQEDNGVKMVLIQQTSSPTIEDKPLRISGEVMRVEKAKAQIYEIISRGRVAGFGENSELTRYAVPAEKAGLVIGKGGESIKEICRVSGSHVEISKEPAPDPSIKIFNIRGNRGEIEQAIRMISERAGIPITRPASGAAVSGAWGQYGYPQADSWSANNGASVGSAPVSGSAMPAPSYNPYTGQPDYSAAWIEYYRRQGMHDYADAIQRQSQQQAATAAQPSNPVCPSVSAPLAPVSHPAGSHQVQPVAPAGHSAPGYGNMPTQQAATPQYDYNQWQQWQQWQAWQQTWQQPGANVPMGQPGMQPAAGILPQVPVGGMMSHNPQQTQ